MKQTDFSRIEAMAAVKAAEEMAEGLVAAGVPPETFSSLTWEQWLDMARAGIARYRVSLRTLTDQEAPF